MIIEHAHNISADLQLAYARTVVSPKKQCYLCVLLKLKFHINVQSCIKGVTEYITTEVKHYTKNVFLLLQMLPNTDLNKTINCSHAPNLSLLLNPFGKKLFRPSEWGG